MLSTFLVATLVGTDPPTSAYTAQQIRGWTVYIENRLQKEKPELYKDTVDLMDNQLQKVVNVLPKDKVKTLQSTKIWVDFASRSTSAMVYHPSRQWLVQNDYNPDKTDSVEVSHPDKFIAWIKPQPYMVLHELAHAYHDQIRGFDDKVIAAAYERAKASGKYDSVKHINGQMRPHYGMNNPMEFFAEMTEAYFGKNDFFPFTKEELKEYDPDTYRWIETEWLKRPEPKQGHRQHNTRIEPSSLLSHGKSIDDTEFAGCCSTTW